MEGGKSREKKKEREESLENHFMKSNNNRKVK